MRSVAKTLRDAHSEDELYLLVANRNSGSYTYDGIERGGERVCVEIEEELANVRSKGGKITKLSIVGYSLGGLVARYAIGLLEAKGVLDQLEPTVWEPTSPPARMLSQGALGLTSVTSHPVELHNLCFTTPRRSHAAARVAQSSLEHPRRAHLVHVGPAAVHY